MSKCVGLRVYNKNIFRGYIIFFNRMGFNIIVYIYILYVVSIYKIFIYKTIWT